MPTDPKPLFRVVDAGTGEPVVLWQFKGVPLWCIDNLGRVFQHLSGEGLVERFDLRAEFLLDPTTGKPPRRFGV